MKNQTNNAKQTNPEVNFRTRAKTRKAHNTNIQTPYALNLEKFQCMDQKSIHYIRKYDLIKHKQPI